ncbi:hypothetical protein NP493_47g02033 [Ridgeia piscesae]|uniref:Uncharacterized protein n=1 Tax=Ridgeia piscesae TaxID=27915 RepID=A0AAD9PBK5_RIDPI|nr:hypothetical protein NP493_47g02033 [Ridgeia piscesae]
MSCKWLVAVAVSLDRCSIATDVSVNMLLPTQSISRMLCYMLTIYIYIYKAVISERNGVLLASERHCLYLKLTPVTNMLLCHQVVAALQLRFLRVVEDMAEVYSLRAAQVLYCDGLHRPVDNDTPASVAFAVTYIIWLVMLLTAVSCHLPVLWLHGWWVAGASFSVMIQ